MISINKPAVKANQTVATTGAVDKYVVKSFIKDEYFVEQQIFNRIYFILFTCLWP